EAAIVTALLRQLDRASVRFFRRVQVDLDGRPAVRLAERAPQDCLPELERGAKLGRRVATLVRPRADATRQVGGGVLVVAHAEGRGPSELDVELDRRIAHRLGQRGELRQPLETVARPT